MVKLSQLKTERYRMSTRVKNLTQSLKLGGPNSYQQMMANYNLARGDDQQTKASAAEKFKCKACLLGFTSKSQIDRHRKTKEHKFHEGQMQKMRQEHAAKEEKMLADTERAYLMESLKLA